MVKNNLVENYEVPVTKTTVVYEYSNATIPELSNIDLNSFIVGGAGTAHWRKGSDLFVQLALYINKNYPKHPIKFNWMGYVNSTEKIILNEDIRKSNLQDVITFTPASPDYLDVFKTFSLLAMTSREDPFPLVCIEIGMMGKPIVCFKGATGSEEIIEKGGGVIVPYLDVPAMAEAIIVYYENRDTLETDGAINKLEFSKFTPEIICPQLWDVISKEL